MKKREPKFTDLIQTFFGAYPKSQHTPGPWNVASYDEDETELAVTIDGYTICLLDQSYFADALPRVEVEANARLISTAPEMYTIIGHLITMDDCTEVEKRAIIASAKQVLEKASGTPRG